MFVLVRGSQALLVYPLLGVVSDGSFYAGWGVGRAGAVFGGGGRALGRRAKSAHVDLRLRLLPARQAPQPAVRQYKTGGFEYSPGYLLLFQFCFPVIATQTQSNRFLHFFTLLRLLEQQQGDLEKYTNHVHSEVVSFCEQRAALEAARVASCDAGNVLSGAWPFKADLMTYAHAIGKFVAGVQLQLKEWEDNDEPLGGFPRSGGSLVRQKSTGAEEWAGVAGWLCPQCTYYNTHAAHAAKCELCSALRPPDE